MKESRTILRKRMRKRMPILKKRGIKTRKR